MALRKQVIAALRSTRGLDELTPAGVAILDLGMTWPGSKFVDFVKVAFEAYGVVLNAGMTASERFKEIVGQVGGAVPGQLFGILQLCPSTSFPTFWLEVMARPSFSTRPRLMSMDLLWLDLIILTGLP